MKKDLKRKMMNQCMSLLAVGVLLSFSLSGVAAGKSLPAKTAADSSRTNGDISAKQLAFHDAMRKLWEDHVTWTRLFLVSAAANLPDKGATTERLLQNQVDIGNAIKAYYGDAAGEKLTLLLKAHIITAAELVAALQANDAAKVRDASKRWTANADEIAAFLSGANPKNWPYADMKQMMHEHLNLTTAEVQARLKGDWTADISAYDKIHAQILHMADMLSNGIISQFPAQFK
jgi:hypothetical protein